MRVLVLTFDCLPRRALGCYGGMEIGTPGFDTLATYGTVFDGCFLETVTNPPDFGFSIEAGGDVSVAGTAIAGPFWRNEKAPRPRRSQLARDLAAALRWQKNSDAEGGLAWVHHPGVPAADWPWCGDDEDEQLKTVSAIDEEVADFFEEWRTVAADDWRLVVASGSGLARRRPLPRVTTTLNPRFQALCDDLVHVPLWFVAGQGTLFGVRSSALCSPRAVGAAIRRWRGGDSVPDEAGLPGDAAFLEAPSGEIVTRFDSDAVSLRTPDWFYRRQVSADGQPLRESLFRKPEDVCDVFDVVQLQSQAGAVLAARLDAILANPGEARPP